MKKVKRKQIDFGGTNQQYVRGDGELGEFNDSNIITLTSIASSIDEISNEHLSCDKTGGEIFEAYNSGKTVEWRLVLSDNLFSYKLEQESFKKLEVGTAGIRISAILYYNDFKGNCCLEITWSLNVVYGDQGNNYVFTNTANYLTNVLRTINHEPLLPANNGNINVHDGFYFPNAIQDYDGNWYGAVVVGDQVWLAENLKTTHYADGTFIPYGNTTHSRTDPYYYHPDGDAENDDIYGLLYNLEAAIQHPFFQNWHVPSSGELNELYNYVIKQRRYTSNNYGDGSAKSYASTLHWNNSETEGTPGNDQSTNNATGFNAIPAGSFYTNRSVGSFFCMWSSSKQTINLIPGAICHYFANNSSRVDNIHRLDADGGYSIRCVSDMTPIQFRDWYIRQYGSLQHHLDENSSSETPTPVNVGDGSLTIKSDDTTVSSFSANQDSNENINFKGGIGITLEPDAENKAITVSAESNHTVISKDLILTGQYGMKVYKYEVRCDLNGSTLDVVDISDFSSKTSQFPHENKYVWTKTANENNVYLGLCRAQGTEGRLVFKLDIFDSVKNKTNTHYYCMMVDTPPDSSFLFMTTCNWEITVRVNDTARRILAYLKVPDDFVGTITLTPLRRTFSEGYEIYTFEYTTELIDYPWNVAVVGGTQQLNTITTLIDNVPTTSGNTNYVRTPTGAYYVNVIGDLGGNLAVGSKVSDSVINDYYIHTIEKRLQDFATAAAIYNLLNLPQPTAGDEGKVLTVDANGQYQLVDWTK